MSILIILAIIILIVAGLIGIFFPVLPGAPLILAGIFIYAFWDRFTHISGWTVGILVALTIFITVVDYIAQIIGAKRYNASRLALICAGFGIIFGFIIGNIWGFIFGPFIGAFIGEMIDSQDLRKAFRSGTGVMIGFLAGTLVKFIVALVMVGIFVGSLVF